MAAVEAAPTPADAQKEEKLIEKAYEVDEKAIVFAKENQGPQTPMMDLCKLFFCCTGVTDDRAVAHKYQRMGPGDYWHVSKRIQMDLKSVHANDLTKVSRSRRASSGRIGAVVAEARLRFFPALKLRVYEDEMIPHEDETEADGRPAVLVWTTRQLIADNKAFVRKQKEKFGKEWVSFLLGDEYCFDVELRTLQSLGSSISDPSYRQATSRRTGAAASMETLADDAAEEESEVEAAISDGEVKENGEAADSNGV